jgi:hypothetical protein
MGTRECRTSAPNVDSIMQAITTERGLFVVKRLFERSGSALPTAALVGSASAPRSTVAGEVTIEVLIPIGARLDGVTGDSEILAAADELATFTGRPVTVATHDVAMQLRATVAGHRVVLMPNGRGEN